MIDIIGNIKVDENNPDRVRYLLASIKSLEFLKDMGKFVLYMEFPTMNLCEMVRGMLNKCGFNYTFIPEFKKMTYGEIHRMLINNPPKQNRYFLNFEEDHFCVLDDAEYMRKVIEVAAKENTDLIKATFHEVESISAKYVSAKHHYGNVNLGEIGKTWRMDETEYTAYQHKWTRFYIGTNHIWNRDFALNFYNRPGKRPHDYEIGQYDKRYEHNAMLTTKEILCSIDDDHDAENSCLLKNPQPKWTRIIGEVDEFIEKHNGDKILRL